MAAHSLRAHSALAMVTVSASAQRAADEDFRDSIRMARSGGWSWMDIANAAGVDIDALRARIKGRPSPVKALDRSLP